ncbi:DUF3189 family protein [Caldalkalibacillus mannanilyticus]|uniref:DUF3189 family protein n=1 Tax=Caldalkalibacillus mannanilyticus TaxID=1418 RepID=UPI00046910DC|nr:DUF3189 family protein [Caldalkalibacillus mannanilyticus]
MKVIYHCYGSAHSSVVAAALHLGKLPVERTPDYTEILRLEDFDVARDDSLGHLFYKGKDESGNEIYTIGMGAETSLVKRSLLSLIEQSKVSNEEFYFAPALPHLHRLSKIGGALSRRYGIEKIGRYLAAKGVCYCYPRMVQFVLETKAKVHEMSKMKEES